MHLLFGHRQRILLIPENRPVAGTPLRLRNGQTIRFCCICKLTSVPFADFGHLCFIRTLSSLCLCYRSPVHQLAGQSLAFIRTADIPQQYRHREPVRNHMVKIQIKIFTIWTFTIYHLVDFRPIQPLSVYIHRAGEGLLHFLPLRL